MQRPSHGPKRPDIPGTSLRTQTHPAYEEDTRPHIRTPSEEVRRALGKSVSWLPIQHAFLHTDGTKWIGRSGDASAL